MLPWSEYPHFAASLLAILTPCCRAGLPFAYTGIDDLGTATECGPGRGYGRRG